MATVVVLASGGGGVHPVGAHALEEGGALGDLAEGLVGEADQVVGPRPGHGPHQRAHHVHPDGPVLPAHQRRAHAPGRVHRRARDGPAIATTQQSHTYGSVNKSAFVCFLVFVGKVAAASQAEKRHGYKIISKI